jgi:hypothetical protein
VANAVELGIPGIEVELGAHLCGLYAGARQRDDVLIPFLEAGLRSGDKCICVVDGSEPTEIVGALGTDVGDSPRGSGTQLDVFRASDVYLHSGAFSASEIISSWKATISDVMYDGRFDAVRAVETWSRRDVVPDTQELLALESEMNRYLPLYPQVILCLYDVERFGGSIVVDLLKTHPHLLLSGAVLDNPYCMTPDEHLAVAAGDAPDAAENERQEVAEWCYAVTTGST